MSRKKPIRKKQDIDGIGRPHLLTWEVFVLICAELERTGVKYASCKKFGFTGQNVTATIKKHKEEGFPEWLDLWEESVELHADALEQEMMRRARDGVTEPVFYKGEVVGEVQKYSDQLAIHMSKGLRPDKFRENVKVDADVSGGVILLPAKMSAEEWVAQREKEAD